MFFFLVQLHSFFNALASSVLTSTSFEFITDSSGLVRELQPVQNCLSILLVFLVVYKLSWRRLVCTVEKKVLFRVREYWRKWNLKYGLRILIHSAASHTLRNSAMKWVAVFQKSEAFRALEHETDVTEWPR